MLNRDIISLGDFNIDFLRTEKFQKHMLAVLPQLVHQEPFKKPALTTFGAVIRSAFTMRGLCLVGCQITCQSLLTGNVYARRTMIIKTPHCNRSRHKEVLTRSSLFHRCMSIRGTAPFCVLMILMM